MSDSSFIRMETDQAVLFTSFYQRPGRRPHLLQLPQFPLQWPPFLRAFHIERTARQQAHISIAITIPFPSQAGIAFLLSGDMYSRISHPCLWGDFPPDDPKFINVCSTLCLINLCTSDKKSSHKIRRAPGPYKRGLVWRRPADSLFAQASISGRRAGRVLPQYRCRRELPR